MHTAQDDGLLCGDYKCLSSPGSIRSCGVAILYRSHFTSTSCSRDQAGRLISACFSSDSDTFQLCNVYGPNSSTAGDQFFQSLYPILDPDLPVVLCGDFNTVVDPIRDRRGCNTTSPWSRQWSRTMVELMSTFDLHDVWRRFHPETSAFTWHRPNGQQASRLDMFWICSLLLPFVLAADILPFFRSDHSYIYLKLVLPHSVSRGRGLWKFNVSHLRDLSFVNMVTSFWESWQAEKSTFYSLSAWWDAGKVRLRNKIRTFSRKRASGFRKQVSSLERTLRFLQQRADRGENVASLLADTRAELEDAHRQQSRGARIRSRIQWAEDGEASTRYFFRLEKRRSALRLFAAIKTLAGVLVSSLIEIQRAWVSFYGLLYTAQQLDITQQNFFLAQLTSTLTDVQSHLCDGELTLEECTAALDGMAGGKSPGLDGFPAEFYRRFWSLLGPDYVEVMNFCYATGQLSASQRSGVITLLYKRGDRLDMKNWRPITLLCVDYKLAAKAIANRLLQVLPHVIHTDQSCSVPGRNPVHNIRLLHDIVSDLNSRGLGGAILSLDQEKAFDRVEWSYLHRVLEKMNFGASFRRWIQLFYCNISSCVLVNGTQSGFFSVTRGVRQGCPLSPLLYVVIAETLACAIRANSRIDGFPLPGSRRVKICQYADDTSIVVTSDRALREVFAIFDRYEAATGAKLNVSKSHGLLVGTWAHRTDLPIALDWSAEHIVVMGSRLSNNPAPMEWDSHLSTLDSVFTSWKTRALSFHGRALIANALGLSTFWYLASFRCIPDTVVSAIKQRLFPFVWQKKREWLARSSLTQPLSRGGLAVVDVNRKVQSLHVMWVSRLVANPDLPWFYFFRHHLHRAFVGRRLDQILLLTSPSQTAMGLLPPFYRSIMESWFRLPRSLDNGVIVIHGFRSVCPVHDLSARFAYRELSRLDSTEHRCVQRYRSWNLAIDWNAVWSNLHLWRFIRPVRDTSWLVAHGILPTADRLLRYGMSVNPFCHCGRPESLIHLFTECPLAVSLLAWYMSLVAQFDQTYAVTRPSEILCGYASSVKIPPIFPCLLGIIRHRIWLARNAHRFDNTSLIYGSVLGSVKSTLRFVLRVQQRHSPVNVFTDLWLANGIFGAISADNVITFPAEFW